MYCNKCGVDNPGTNEFCTQCGSRLDRAAQGAAPQPPAKKKDPTAPSVGKRILTVVLCLLLTISMLVTGALGLGRSLLSSDNIAEMVGEVKLEDIEVEMDGETYTLDELIYENLDSNAQEIFTKRTIRNALEDRSVRRFISQTIAGYTRYLTDGSRMKTIDAKDIADFIDKEIDNLSDGEIRNLSDRQYDSLVNAMEDVIDFDGLKKRGMEEISGVDLDAIQTLLSPTIYWICAGVCAVLLVQIIWLNRRKLRFLIPVAVPLLVLGVLYLLLAVAIGFIPDLIPIENIEIASPIFSSVSSFYTWRCIILLAVGVLAIVARKLFRKKTTTVA